MIKKISLFDTHCHLNSKDLAKDLDGVLDRAQKAGLVGMATIGCDLRSSLFAVHLAEKYPQITCTVGYHPSDTQELTPEIFRELADLATDENVKAIGEIGLDYHWDTPRDVQRKWFLEQLHLAKDFKKPTVIHDLEAHGD